MEQIYSAKEMRRVLSKEQLSIDELYNSLTKKVLKLLLGCGTSLIPVLRNEMRIINTIFVSAVIRDDLKQLSNNIDVIKSAIKLKELEIKPFYLN